MSLVSYQVEGQSFIKDFLDGEKVKTLKFELHQGFIVVDLKVNNIIPMKFIFDTGSKHIILFEKIYADIININYDRKIRLYGADMNKEMFAYIARNVNFKLGNFPNVKRDMVILEEDFLLLKEVIGTNIDGILGGSFFKGLVVEIDYKKKRIHFHDPDHFIPGSKFEASVDLIVEEDKPYIWANHQQYSTDTTKNLKILMDTGAALSFLVHTNSDDEITLPRKLITGNIGKGLGGDLIGYVSKSYHLSFGQYEFKNLVTSYQDLNEEFLNNKVLFRNGMLGYDILSRFNFAIDYMKKKVYFNANKKYNEEFKFDMSGLIVLSIGTDLNQYYIKNVIPLSPADLAGIRKGDVIKKINSFGVRFWNLKSINKLLSKKEGKKIKMVIERDGLKKKIEFKLKDYIGSI